MITIKLLDSVEKISSDINQAIASSINSKIKKNSQATLYEIKKLIPNWVESQPEISSLYNQAPGTLFALLGLRSGDPQKAVKSIIDSVSDSISIKIKPVDKKLSGGIEFYFQPKDFSNLLSLNEGFVIYGGGSLHWLDWMLTRGSEIIVANYYYSPEVGLGRSKQGIMEFGGSFRIPPQFSGTITDNFITRALVGVKQEKEISNVLEGVLLR